MQGRIQRVLIDRQAIDQRLDEVAREIINDLYDDPAPRTIDDLGRIDGQEAHLTIVPILTGSMIFVSDLIRKLPIRMQIHMVSVSSYPGASTTTKGAKLSRELTNLPEDLSGDHVLVLDDILDSGHTLRMVSELIRARKPKSVRIGVLLRKRIASAMSFPVDYVCFDIPDEFVVGYGLDYDDYFRNLPDIVTLDPSTFQAQGQG